MITHPYSEMRVRGLFIVYPFFCCSGSQSQMGQVGDHDKEGPSSAWCFKWTSRCTWPSCNAALPYERVAEQLALRMVNWKRACYSFSRIMRIQVNLD
jgi:hypothetical protein